MDKKESLETTETEKTKPRINWNKWDVFFSVAIVVLIIFIPLGGIIYLGGRFSGYPVSSAYACLIYFSGFCLLFVFVIAGAIQILCNWKIYTSRKKLIKTIQIGILILFFTSFVISIFTPIETYLWQPGYKLTTYGYRDRLRKEADIEAVRDWLRTLKKENCTGERINLVSGSDYSKRYWPDSIEWPESLKVLSPRLVCLDLDENGKPKIRLTWNEFMSFLGVEIGMEDMEIPTSDFRRLGEYRLPLESGAYVWHELR
jgi:hypothetical protein